MLQLVFTGHHLLANRRERLTREAKNWVLADGDTLYHAKRYEDVAAPGFEHDTLRASLRVTVPEQAQKLLFGLLDCCLLPQMDPSPGLCVTLDLSMGVVMDALNGSGVLGYVDESRLAPGTEVLVEVELTMRGGNCLPQLWIAGERLLHPAFRLARVETMDLVAGSALQDGGGLTVRAGAVAGAGVALTP